MASELQEDAAARLRSFGQMTLNEIATEAAKEPGSTLSQMTMVEIRRRVAQAKIQAAQLAVGNSATSKDHRLRNAHPCLRDLGTRNSDLQSSNEPVTEKLRTKEGAAPGKTLVGYFSCVEIELKVDLSFVPRPFTTAMIATEMPAAIRPYSMAVAADSSLRNALNLVRMATS